MLIRFVPQRSDAAPPVLAVAGDVLTIDGETCDFAGVTPDGAVLPGEAIGHPALLGAARVGAALEVSVLLPIGASPTPSQCFPLPVDVAAGPVALP